jgi:hypothetical protein
MLFSCAFRVVSTSHPPFLLNPNLYFPLIVAPEAVSALLLTLGRAYAQVGLGGRLGEFQAKQLPWQQARAAAAADKREKEKAAADREERTNQTADAKGEVVDPEQGLPAVLARAT